MKMRCALSSAYRPHDQTYIQFRIGRIHLDAQDYRLVYIAETLDKKQILVKFTRRYSIVFCVRFVPVVDGAPGHFSALGISQEVGPLLLWTTSRHRCRPPDHPILSVSCDKWISDLENLVQGFRDHGLVQGEPTRAKHPL
ncbi:hypothetical protein BJV74DRAFT_305484 [Russula compacta]|nr:hypothetical protein BJV74DRAFT_305484 [Russula compacta]